MGILGRLRYHWFNTRNERLLLLSFPRGADEKKLKADDKLRHTQFINLLENYSEETKEKAVEKSITTWHEFSTHVDDFLKEKCIQTKLATIIFNGHGSENGLRFNKDGHIPLDTIITEIRTCLDAINMDPTRVNPQAVDIIFGQCFGHVHSAAEDEWSQLNVISLTGKKGNYTFSETECHYDLKNKVAERKSAEERLLMLSFPLKDKFASDNLSRKMQNEAFIIQYGITYDRCSQKSITCFNDLSDSLEEFLDRDCIDTELATVVFNGHGNKNGLLFENSGSVPLDQILAKVQEIIENIHIERKNPKHVIIVFAQSYSHLHSYSRASGTIASTPLDVVSLTSARRPWSLVITRRDRIDTSQPIRSEHAELMEYACFNRSPVTA